MLGWATFRDLISKQSRGLEGWLSDYEYLFSCRGPEVGFQHPCGSQQPALIPVLGESDTVLMSLDSGKNIVYTHPHAHSRACPLESTQAHIQVHTHTTCRITAFLSETIPSHPLLHSESTNIFPFVKQPFKIWVWMSSYLLVTFTVGNAFKLWKV